MPKSVIFAGPLGSHHDVRRLDVAVHDAVLVRVGEALGDLRRDRHRLRHGDALALAHQRAQLDALDVLHRHEDHLARLADVVHGDDVGMVEAAAARVASW